MIATYVFLIAAACLIGFGNLWMIVNGFRVSLLWGLLILFIPLAPLVFLFLYWEDARRPFLCALFGVLLLIPPVIIHRNDLGALVTKLGQGLQQTNRPTRDSAPAPESPAAILEHKKAALLAHANEMNARYADLMTRQKNLATADAATKAAFAADSAAYTALRQQVAAEKAEVETLQAQAAGK